MVSLNTVIQCMISVVPFMYSYIRIILNFLGNFRLLQTDRVKCSLLLYIIIIWGSTNLTNVTMAYCRMVVLTTTFLTRLS